MTRPVVRPSEAKSFPNQPQGSTKFGATLTPLTEALAMPGLGAMMTVVEPGRRAFPFHNHLGNDEMFVILEGEGTYRHGAMDWPVQAGDICAAPRGGPGTAHQLINTGTKPLRYLSVSTRNDPDVVEYPDSGKFAATAIAPGQNFFDAHLKFVGRLVDSRDYYEGEDL